MISSGVMTSYFLVSCLLIFEQFHYLMSNCGFLYVSSTEVYMWFYILKVCDFKLLSRVLLKGVT